MKYNIKKAKIKANSIDVEMEEIIYHENTGPITNDVKKTSDQLVHDDLRAAFDKLKAHLVIICDQKEDELVLIHLGETRGEPNQFDSIDKEHLQNITVTGFVIGGDSDNEGVTLIGQKKIDKKVLNLISPFTKYADYDHGDDLAEAIHECICEVEEYLFNGKCCIIQPELPFDETFEGDNDGVLMTVTDGEGNESGPITIGTMKAVTKKLKKIAEEQQI